MVILYEVPNCQKTVIEEFKWVEEKDTKSTMIMMSIYATLWSLKFPKFGDDHIGCEWIKATAQGVPPHIGSPTPGSGYEDGDPYAEFLPPAVVTNEDGEAPHMRAVVFVTENTEKGTPRHGQQYVNPLLTISGAEYDTSTFADLHKRICDALRGDRPAVTMQMIGPDGTTKIFFEDGTFRQVNPDEA